MKKEYILCAAIHFDDGKYYTHHERRGTGVVACGHRHHEIFVFRPKDFNGKETQGFLTSTGRFVDRKEAREIAEAAGQLIPDQSGMTFSNLFSENLY